MNTEINIFNSKILNKYNSVARRQILLYGISALLYVYFYLSSFLSSVYVKSVKIYYSSCSNGEFYLPGCLLISTTTTGDLTTRRFKIVIHASVILCGHFSTVFCKFQLHSNRDFVVVVLLSTAQTPGQPTTPAQLFANANPPLLCICWIVYTVGIPFSCRPVRYRPDP